MDQDDTAPSAGRTKCNKCGRTFLLGCRLLCSTLRLQYPTPGRTRCNFFSFLAASCARSSCSTLNRVEPNVTLCSFPPLFVNTMLAVPSIASSYRFNPSIGLSAVLTSHSRNCCSMYHYSGTLKLLQIPRNFPRTRKTSCISRSRCDTLHRRKNTLRDVHQKRELHEVFVS